MGFNPHISHVTSWEIQVRESAPKSPDHSSFGSFLLVLCLRLDLPPTHLPQKVILNWDLFFGGPQKKSNLMPNNMVTFQGFAESFSCKMFQKKKLLGTIKVIPSKITSKKSMSFRKERWDMISTAVSGSLNRW